jgi:hypothetical protein
MKKLILLTSLTSFIFISCKKDRVCNCSITTSGTTTTQANVSISAGGFPIPIADTTFVAPLYKVDQNKITYTKVKKRVAKNNCFNKTENINESNPTIIPGFLNVTVTNTGTRTYSCKLE